MNISFKNNINHSYMVIEKTKEFSEHHFLVKMLLENEISGLLSAGYECVNGEYNMLYDISSKQAFSRLFEIRKMSFENLRAFLFSLKGVLRTLNEYLMDPDNIILKQECIFADPSGLQYSFCYYPYYQGNLLLELRELLDKMISLVDYEEEKSVRLIYELRESLQEENATIDKLLKVYEKVGGEQLPKIQKVIPPEEFQSRLLPQADVVWRGKRKESFQAREAAPAMPAVPSQNWQEDGTLEEESSFIEKLKYYLKGHSFIEILEDLNNRELMQKIRQCGKLAELPEPFKPSEAICPKPAADFEYISFSDFDFKDKMAEQTTYGGTVLLGTEQKEMHKLVGLKEQKEQRFIIQKYPYTIGKAEKDSDAFLDEKTVSRTHARIYEKEGGYYIEDLNSMNGTYLNEERLPAYTMTPIAEGDILRFAEAEFCFR